MSRVIRIDREVYAALAAERDASERNFNDAVRRVVERSRTVAIFDWDDLAPRRPEERYRIYRVRGGQRDLLATTPSPQGVGLALCELRAQGDLTEDDAVGVLDAAHGSDDAPLDGLGRYTGQGLWVISPYAQGARRRDG